MILNFLHTLAQLLKQLFYANPLSILNLPTTYNMTCRVFLLLRRLLQSSKNTLNTIFVCKNGFDHHGTASSNNCPSFFHSRNLGNMLHCLYILVKSFNDLANH